MRVIRRARNRKVRLHTRDGGPSIEGVLAGRCDGHYILWAPKVIEGPEATVSVSGHIEVPERQVLFLQILG